jgi:hypothetical protein
MDETATPSLPRRWGGPLLVACLLLYFGAWGLLTPPLLAPDERGHLVKALSVPSNGWVTPSPDVEVANARLNPLVLFRRIHAIPGNPSRRLSAADVGEMKRATWPSDPDGRTHLTTSAHMYPLPFYAVVLALGQGVSGALSLSPYASVYAFRAVCGLLGIALWAALFARLRFLGAFRSGVFALLLLVPMVGILGSSISPDAVFIPLCALFIVSSYGAIFGSRSPLPVAAALLALAFTKSSAAFFLFPTLAALVGAAWLRARICGAEVRIHWRNAALLIGGVLALFYAGFYHWSPYLRPEFTDRFQKQPIDFVLELGLHGRVLFASFWLALGLPDTLAPLFVQRSLLALLALNTAAFGWAFRTLGDKGRFAYLIGFALLYATALLAGEYANFGKTGYFLQGRYFLPVALGFFALTCHPVRVLRWTLLAAVAAFNLYAMHLSVERYYGGDWALVQMALPFTDPPPF